MKHWVELVKQCRLVVMQATHPSSCDSRNRLTQTTLEVTCATVFVCSRIYITSKRYRPSRRRFQSIPKLPAQVRGFKKCVYLDGCLLPVPQLSQQQATKALQSESPSAMKPAEATAGPPSTKPLSCKRFGCGATFLESSNTPSSCLYHEGPAEYSYLNPPLPAASCFLSESK